MSGGTVTVTEFTLAQEMGKHFIDGMWVKGDRDEPIDVLNPSNNETIFQLLLRMVLDYFNSTSSIITPSGPSR